MRFRSSWEANPSIRRKESTGNETERFLTLHNDDVHTFDYVIESLIEVCAHDPVQAEQCTFIVHYKGKCDVMKGPGNFLEPMREDLSQRGLTVTIE
jgi:ATP-dependent Clp protease adaptor protein ClpS